MYKNIFVNQNYKVNIKKGLTYFSPLGSSIGDHILFTAIKKKYKEDNPNETIEFFQMPVFMDEILKQKKPDKLFWCSATNFLKKPDDRIDFDLHKEVTRLASVGYYPELEFELDLPELDIFYQCDDCNNGREIVDKIYTLYRIPKGERLLL